MRDPFDLIWLSCNSDESVGSVDSGNRIAETSETLGAKDEKEASQNNHNNNSNGETEEATAFAISFRRGAPR